MANSIKVVEVDGRMVGLIEVWDLMDPPVNVWVWGRVHPEFEGQGIGKHSWPENIKIRTFADLKGDLRQVYRAVDDAFRDHWDYVEQPEDETLKRWQHFIENNKEYDPSLWFLAMDGDEIAGLSLCKPHMTDDPQMGWVNTLGVRRPWRRQGLAMALLHHTFAEFQERGQQRVGLGVDAGSLTGATRLYEKAGMHVEREYLDFTKLLRPGKDISRQTLDD